ncbi:hypothetical protein JG688_00017554, partial [Phytophthora aleatoria]
VHFRLAQMFQKMEVPFVAYGIPELTAATKRWTDEYRTEKLSPKALYKVHVAYDNHFMYYLTSKQLAGEKDTGWEALRVLLLVPKKNDFSKQASFIRSS